MDAPPSTLELAIALLASHRRLTGRKLLPAATFAHRQTLDARP